MLRFDYKQYEERTGESVTRYGIASVLLTIEDVVASLGRAENVERIAGAAAATAQTKTTAATCANTMLRNCVEFCEKRSLDFLLVMTMVLGDGSDGVAHRQLLGVDASGNGSASADPSAFLDALVGHCVSSGVELSPIASEAAKAVEESRTPAFARAIVDGRNSRKKIAPAVATFLRKKRSVKHET